jgi:tetratricopeptide (TPR) repeat protein
MAPKFFTSRIVFAIVLAVFIYAAPLVASDRRAVRGYVESADGKRLKHVSVRITAVAGTTTTDSGEFASNLPSSFGAGDAVLFSVDGWVIMQPYVSVRGRMYLPGSEKELVELVVAKKGDARLLQKDQIAQMVQTLLLEGSRTKTSADTGPAESRGNGDEFFSQTAEELGFDVRRVKDAIALWAKTVEEPYQKGLVALYEQRYPQAIDLITKSIQPMEKDLVQRYICLWIAHLDNGEFVSAEEVIRKAKAIRASDSDVLLDLGTVLNAEEKYSEAAIILQEAKYAMVKECGSHSPHLPTALNNLAYSYTALGRYADAEPLYKEALEIDQTTYGRDDPEVAMDVGNIGHLYLQTHREKDAESWLIRAKDIDVKRYGPEDPRAGRDFTNLGVFYDSQGRLQEALEYFQLALATDKQRQNANPHNSWIVQT